MVTVEDIKLRIDKLKVTVSEACKKGEKPLADKEFRLIRKRLKRLQRRLKLILIRAEKGEKSKKKKGEEGEVKT
ncbi:MAG: hypothetical protein ACC630_03250 [Nitrospinota bacterium]